MFGSYVCIFFKVEMCKMGLVLFRGYVFCEFVEFFFVKIVNVSFLILLIFIVKKRKNEDVVRWVLCLFNLVEDWGLSRDWVMWYVDG